MTSVVDAVGCPARKLTRPGDDGPLVERVVDAEGEHWVFRSFPLVREVLRTESAFIQAGFGADDMGGRASMRPPILYLEGAEHREQRGAAARLFAPKVIEGYRPMMTRLSAELVGRLRDDKTTDLSVLSLRMAVEVAARVVGLTNSSLRGMTRRLDTFFDGEPLGSGGGPRGALRSWRQRAATMAFYWFDVLPAIRARRRDPGPGDDPVGDDVISQLIRRDFSDLEILTECLTYGAAGMVTTREFITVVAWHLLDEPALLARFRAGDRAARLALLEEALRLEPVVGHLRRRATRDITLTGPEGPVEVAAGEMVDLHIRAADADEATVGELPLRLCPDRSLPRAVPGAVLALGDGHHRCPGGPIALLESEIFLSELFAHEIVAVRPPRVQWNPITMGYDLDRFELRLARPAETGGWAASAR